MVERVMDTISSMVNPWDLKHSKLINISSGRLANEDVATDLLSALAVGENATNEFINSRLVSPSTDVFATLKSNKLKTFASVEKKKRNASTAVVKSNRSVFARLLIVANKREVNLKSILCYSLSPIPLALSTADGTLCKTVKSDLLKVIEEDMQGTHTVEVDELGASAVIIDAMALVQAIPATKLPQTFGLLAEYILQQLLQTGKFYNSNRVDFVGDRYYDTSIKSAERQKRSGGEGQQVSVYSSNQKIPQQWKKFLSVGTNKEELLSFLSSYFKSAEPHVDMELFATEKNKCFQIVYQSSQPTQVIETHELCSNQEEADTRLLLHAYHASQSSADRDVVIKSPDTDVAILCIKHSCSIKSKLFFATGTKNKNRIIDIKEVAHRLGRSMCDPIVGLHALTGCDTTSAFYGKGKRKAYKMLKNDEQALVTLSKLGESYSLSQQLIDEIEVIVCKLYTSKCKDINLARYEIFCSTAGAEQSMPPTKDALTQHVRRVNYQSVIWLRSLQASHEIPSPKDHGWMFVEENLCICWMTGPTAPPDLLKSIHCSCSTSKCVGQRCSCRKMQLQCTDFCSCNACENDAQIPVVDTDSDSNVDDDDEEI